MGIGKKVGQQLALTGDLGRSYPSKGLRISSFAKEKRWQHEKNKARTRIKGNKGKEKKLT